MLLKLRWLICLLFLSPLLGAHAQTVTAASCSAADVQKALNAVAADGTTVNIPAGNCSWTTTVTYNQVFSTTILGAGSQSVIGGGDATVIVDNVSHTPTDNPTLVINTASGKSFRISGLTFQGGTGGQGFAGAVRIRGNSQSVRFDHIHFLNLNDANLVFGGWEYGVVDHCLFQQLTGSVTNGIRVNHEGWNSDTGGFGDLAYADQSLLGSSKAIFVEDNTFGLPGDAVSPNFPNGYADDSQLGGRMVFRHNTLNRVVFQGHGTQDRRRGMRMFEVYKNTFNWQCNPNCGTDQYSFAMYLRSGTGVIWGNSTVGFINMVSAHNDRSENQFTFPDWATTGSASGYCGTVNGTASTNLWDGNSDSSGYPCLDQMGRGAGDAISGNAPTQKDSAVGAQTWPRQALEPIYEWNDAYTPAPNNGFDALWASNSGPIVANRDYYLGTTNAGTPISFNGTVGVGTGLLSARPATCTKNVAYFATDTNTLYQCSATNTWTPYYTPFTYPHPLVAGGTGTTPPPAPPTGLTGTAH